MYHHGRAEAHIQYWYPHLQSKLSEVSLAVSNHDQEISDLKSSVDLINDKHLSFTHMINTRAQFHRAA